MPEEVSIKEYRRIYHRTIKEFAKKDFISEIRIIVLVFAVFAILSTWKIIDFGIVIQYAVLIPVFGVLLLIRSQYYYNYEVKEEFTDIETLKKAYRELRKNIAKRSFFIYILFLVICAIYNFLLHGFSPRGIEGYIFLLVGFGLISSIEFREYKKKIAEKELKKIETKVEDRVRRLKGNSNIPSPTAYNSR